MDKVAASMDRRPINSPAIVPLTTRRPRDIFINPLNWYEENGIKLHAGIRANSIDRQAKVVSSGSVVEPYDKLVIATGSSPFLPPLENLSDEAGGLKKGIFVFRTLNDCTQMIKYSDSARKAVVVGGGLLGLEAACSIVVLRSMWYI